MNSQLSQLVKLAEKLDCSVIQSGDEYALQVRHYDEDGVPVVRYWPDNNCFHQINELIKNPVTC